MQSEAAAEAADDRLSALARELESKAAADSDALRRLQETIAVQQESLQKVRLHRCMRLFLLSSMMIWWQMIGASQSVGEAGAMFALTAG